MRNDRFEIVVIAVMEMLLLMLVVWVMTGCKICEPCIPIVNDSVRVETRLDSIYLYERDSVWVDRWRSGDTVFITKDKWHTRYKDVVREVHDTIATNVVQEKRVEVVPKYYQWTSSAFWVVVAILAVMIAVKIGWKYLKK